MAVVVSKTQIWSNPSRSISVSAEYQNRTETSVQIRLTVRLYLNSELGYSGYASYFKPTVNGVALSKVTQKSASVSSWYGDPIVTTTIWRTYTITENATSIPISVVFSTDDPEDSNVTKSGTLTIPVYTVPESDNGLYININGTWVKSTPCVRTNLMNWQEGIVYINIDGTWIECS